VTAAPARRLWGAVEPLHAAVYFHPEASSAYKVVGLKGFWMGYFASRAAALGPVGAEVVTAAFYGFAPGMVARAVPDCWARATVADILAVRHRLAADALAVPATRSGLDIPALADDLVAAVGRLSFEGRVLAGAHVALPIPDEPVLRLWWACTVLREHRGDGHVAALLAHGISPVEAHVLKVAAGEASEAALRPFRGWGEDEWQAARLGLFARSLLTEAGELTDDGSMMRLLVEHVTDVAAEPGWWALGGGDASEEVLGRLRALSRALRDEGSIPFPNAMGLPGAAPA
jgi:hypothetical protein